MGKDGQIQPEFYYALVTMHGTILVFFVLTGGLSGTFANFLIPLQIGARDMLHPSLTCCHTGSSYGQHRDALLPVHRNRPASGAGPLSPLAHWGMLRRIKDGDGPMDHFHGLVCRLFPVRWSKLYLHDP